MKSEYNLKYNLIKKSLGIDRIVSVRFSNQASKRHRQYRDTACTALARSLKNKKLVYLDRKSGQLCPGGDYFLQIRKFSRQEVSRVYLKDERVFGDKTACLSFLNNLPKYPQPVNKRYIFLTPLEKETSRPDLIIMLANPAQVSRVLGLSVYKKMIFPHLLPAGPTCISLYASLSANRPHLNLLDYYDRYYQGRQNNKLIWKNEEMLVTLPFKLFSDIIKYIPCSAQGSFKPRTLKPFRVTKFL